MVSLDEGEAAGYSVQLPLGMNKEKTMIRKMYGVLMLSVGCFGFVAGMSRPAYADVYLGRAECLKATAPGCKSSCQSEGNNLVCRILATNPLKCDCQPKA
jgi:hypothetical protein